MIFMEDELVILRGLDQIESDLELWISRDLTPSGGFIITKRFVACVGDYKILVHTRDHDPVHFHVESNSHNMKFAMLFPSLQFYRCDRGSVESGAIQKVQRYFSTNRNAITLLETRLKECGLLK